MSSSGGDNAAPAASVTTMASAMLFGTIIFVSTALFTRAVINGNYQQLSAAASHPKSSALDVKSMQSVYTLLFHSSVFGLILFYAYICEYHPPYPHAIKNYDADFFFFLTFLLFAVSAFTWQKHDPNDNQAVYSGGDKSHSNINEEGSPHDNNSSTLIRPVAPQNDKMEVLNRNQTEEWKGWMQFMFLLYHYYHAEEVYNSIRIMITCYVWMTGFGNFSFFYLKADYGLVRVLQMLWRLNFLVLFLCLTQGTTFILYYICLLHTYYFFMVYITMRIGHTRNYTKWFLRTKLAILAVVIYLIWDCDLGLFKVIHYPFFGETPILGATAGTMWEWYFRSSLDHWSTFLGMTFALNFPITSLFFRKLESLPFHRHVLAKGLMGIVLLGVFLLWVTGPFMQGKFDYNQTNSYYGFIPLITYIYFRNLTPFLRNHSLDLLHQIGKTTLETYLMQHHIWLTSDAKSLLTLIPGWPKVNFLVVSVLYVTLSRRLYQLTLFLRGMVLPNNLNACIKNLAGMASIIASFCGLAYILESQGHLNMPMVGMISCVCGYLLYSFVLKYTLHIGNTAEEEQAVDRTSNNKKTMVISCATAIVALSLCGISWHVMAVTGATKIRLLPRSCDEYANKGNWMSLNGCDEGPRGEEYRNYGISSESTCSAQNSVLVWGWDAQQSSSHCRFQQRDVKSLKKHLKDRTIYFAGDSITRNLYHSFCRQLGISEAGAYNATGEKHHNLSQQIGDIKIEFIWAGYTTEVVETVTNLTLSNSVENSLDLVVLGCGAWDKLWKYDSDEDKEALESAVDDLRVGIKKLRKLKVPVVWLTPTSINTAALPTEEKRAKINEDEMKKIRDLYEAQNILSSSSFVIHGEAFTSTRISESFDGVHFSHSVYSAGAQILCNAIDWLLPNPRLGLPKPPPTPGAMAHPLLGLMILCFAAAAIFLFDGFLGFSYLAAFVVPSVAPKKLFYEAFSMLHETQNLPALEMQGLPKTNSKRNGINNNIEGQGSPTQQLEVEEGVSLLGRGI